MLFTYPLLPNPDDATSPVVGFFCDEKAADRYPAHRHRRGQLIHATDNVFIATTDVGDWIVPPHRALWIPAGVEHSVAYPYGVSLRTLYIDVDALALVMPGACTVFQLDPLARELIKAAAELPWEAALDGSGLRLVHVLLDRLAVCAETVLHLPWGRDKRLTRVMDELYEHPSDTRSLDELARTAHCSSRTLARLFVRETGMSLGTWRQQLRLRIARERLAEGLSVTQVAFDLGYDSVASFSTMFRKACGVPPSRIFGDRAAKFLGR
jgi:AraC-like DNA-binding protein